MEPGHRPSRLEGCVTDALEAAASSEVAPRLSAAGSTRGHTKSGAPGRSSRSSAASVARTSLCSGLWMGTQNPEAEECRRSRLRATPPGSIHQLSKASLKLTRSDSKLSSTVELSERRASGCYFELFAAAVGDVEWLRFCMNRKQHGGIPTDKKGFAAIHFAAQEGKLDCLQVLIEEYQFPVNLPTKNHQTPLHLVIHKDNKPVALPCIYYLLQKGAAINSKTSSGSTPLHLASREGMLSCVKFLVQNGANVHAKDAINCKPVDYCKIWNRRACARFLKDAMWKRDKKDFAREMGKLKRLKDQLLIMEHDYVLEYQKERQLLREADFRKWLRSKLPCQGQSLVYNTKEEEANVPPLSTALFKTQKSLIPMSYHPSLEGHLQNILQPVMPPKLSYKKPIIRRPTAWNISTNPATPPTTEIRSPQGIRLGVHPDPCLEHDFRDFLEVTPDFHGGAWLQTVNGHWVAPVPKLPYEVIVRVLYPGAQPFRMKVPQGLYPVNILDVPKKKHFSEDTFQANALVMNLHETFDEAFLAAIQAHQGLLALPSPQDSP